MRELPDDYFIDADDKLVDFMEKQGENCIREIYQSNQTNKENGYRLLSILIVGIGSSFLLLTQNPHPDFVSAGIAVFTVYWSVCAILLVLGVLSVQTRGLVSSTPDALYTETYKTLNQSDYSYLKSTGFTADCNRLAVMRRFRLKELSVTAAELVEANVRIRTRLTRVRLAVILAPIIAITASVTTYISFHFI
ncbi:hypothetical protein QW46_13835 [Salmonella enterica]|nr:hypothetical protein [Salmonella enterica]